MDNCEWFEANKSFSFQLANGFPHCQQSQTEMKVFNLTLAISAMCTSFNVMGSHHHHLTTDNHSLNDFSHFVFIFFLFRFSKATTNFKRSMRNLCAIFFSLVALSFSHFDWCRVGIWQNNFYIIIDIYLPNINKINWNLLNGKNRK